MFKGCGWKSEVSFFKKERLGLVFMQCPTPAVKLCLGSRISGNKLSQILVSNLNVRELSLQ